MPILAGLMMSLFAGFAQWLAQWLTKKTAFAVAAVATFAVLTLGLYGVLAGLIAGLSMTVPPGALCTLLWVAVPDQVPGMIAACIACDTAVALYHWNTENLRLASYVT